MPHRFHHLWRCVIATAAVAAFTAPAAPRSAAAPPHAAGALAVNSAGRALVAALDRLDVERHWLRDAGPVAWRTGEPLKAAERRGEQALPAVETHCSAFAAAAADSLGIYLLRPPDHSNRLLANAQSNWLASDAGRQAGWQPVTSSLDAQRLANAGRLVVAVFKNPTPTCAGHIAIVRPASVTPKRIAQDGPQVTQAGDCNSRSTTLAKGFKEHAAAWRPHDRGCVRYFAHAPTKAQSNNVPSVSSSNHIKELRGRSNNHQPRGRATWRQRG